MLSRPLFIQKVQINSICFHGGMEEGPFQVQQFGDDPPYSCWVTTFHNLVFKGWDRKIFLVPNAGVWQVLQ